MPASQFFTAPPSSMPPMFSVTRDQHGFSTGHSNDEGAGLQEYLNGDMFYQESMPKEVQLNPSLLSELGNSPLNFPPRPRSVVQGPRPEGGSLSSDTKSTSQSHGGSILLVD